MRDPRCGQPILRPGLQAEARVQVLAHDQVLDLSRLSEQVPQVLTMLNDDLRLGHLRHDSSPAARWPPEATGIGDGQIYRCQSTPGPLADQQAGWRRPVRQIVPICAPQRLYRHAPGGMQNSGYVRVLPDHHPHSR